MLNNYEDRGLRAQVVGLYKQFEPEETRGRRDAMIKLIAYLSAKNDEPKKDIGTRRNDPHLISLLFVSHDFGETFGNLWKAAEYFDISSEIRELEGILRGRILVDSPWSNQDYCR